VSTCARIKANRQNSTRSTGPRTKSGKARSSQNAKKHALTLPLRLIPSLEPEIDALARLIVPDDAASVCYEAARGVAEAQIDLRRVKAARSLLLNAQDDTREVAEMIGDLARDLLRLDRYERNARWRRKQAVRYLHLALA